MGLIDWILAFAATLLIGVFSGWITLISLIEWRVRKGHIPKGLKDLGLCLDKSFVRSDKEETK